MKTWRVAYAVQKTLTIKAHSAKEAGALVRVKLRASNHDLIAWCVADGASIHCWP